MLIAQSKLTLTISTPLGEDALIIDRLTGTEQVCRPYCFEIVVHSHKASVDWSKLMAGDVKVCLNLKGYKRYFCGMVGDIQFGQSDKAHHLYRTYILKIYPWFWKLKFSKNYQIFQNQTPIEIIKSLLTGPLKDKTKKCGQEKREFCVQYGESHFDFVSRLMEEEGIYYFFEHTDAGETMILCDDDSHITQASHGTLPVTLYKGQQPPLQEIQFLNLRQKIVPKDFATADYNFETASTPLYSKVSGKGEGGLIYQYPGLYTKSEKGDSLSGLRLHELEWAKKTIYGRSTAASLYAMSRFKVTNHPYEKANGTYIAYEVTHTLNQHTLGEDIIYENTFQAYPDTVEFRPARQTPKPIIPSTQTAIVTGKEGEEIWCDEYGRIKIKFHWDQQGSKDEKSSCWVRVAQMWAGAQWGTLFTPRVGMEVVVTFLDGNPDRPLITGCVYNSDQMPPYAEEEPTKSTLKTNTSKEGQGFNELRFEDKKDKEEIFIQAQKDMNTIVKHDRTLTINTGHDTTDILHGNRTVTLHAEKSFPGNDMLTLAKGSQTITLEGKGDDPGNRTIIVAKGDETKHIKKGNQQITLDEGNQTIELKKGNQKITLSDGSYKLNVEKGDSTLTLNGKLTIKVTGAILIKTDDKLTLQAAQDIAIKSDMNVSIEAGMDFKLKAGTNMNIEAGINLEAKAVNTTVKGEANTIVKGGASVMVEGGGAATIKSDGVTTVKGSMVMIG